MPYRPEDLASLQAQIVAAVATGLPWMIENAQKAWQHTADTHGGPLPFDASGNPVAGAPALPPPPQFVTDAISATAGAIDQGKADGVYNPPAPAGNPDDSFFQPPADPANGGPAAPPAPEQPPSLQEDPAFQAFVRAAGLEREMARRNTQDAVDRVNRGVALQLPQIGEQGSRMRERISGSFETRGLLRSGDHERDLSRQRQQEADVTSAAQNDAADRIAALKAALGQTEVGMDTRLAEQQLAAAGRLQEFRSNQDLQQQHQGSLAALLAEQKRSNDALTGRYDDLLRRYGGGGGAPATGPQAGRGDVEFDPANPTRGIVGIVPGADRPDHLERMRELQKRQRGGF